MDELELALLHVADFVGVFEPLEDEIDLIWIHGAYYS
jgi:hypothetical protein